MFKKNFVNTRIYTLLIEGDKYTFLSTQLAQSLEEAYALAKNDFIKKNPNNVDAMFGAKIGLFEIKKIHELFFGVENKQLIDSIEEFKKAEDRGCDLTQSSTKKIEISEKNKLMKFILDSKNKEIFEKNKNLFTETEVKYISDKLSENKINIKKDK